jgi:hypothetical protein
MISLVPGAGRGWQGMFRAWSVNGLILANLMKYAGFEDFTPHDSCLRVVCYGHDVTGSRAAVHCGLAHVKKWCYWVYGLADLGTLRILSLQLNGGFKNGIFFASWLCSLVSAGLTF